MKLKWIPVEVSLAGLNIIKDSHRFCHAGEVGGYRKQCFVFVVAWHRLKCRKWYLRKLLFFLTLSA
jgi:hypothetical protein